MFKYIFLITMIEFLIAMKDQKKNFDLLQKTKLLLLIL